MHKEELDILENFEKRISQNFDPDFIKNELNLLKLRLDFPEIINFHLEKLTNQRYYFPLKSSYNKLCLLENDKFQLSIFDVPPTFNQNKEEYLYSFVNDVFYCPLITNPDFNYIVYEQEHTNNPSVINNRFRLKIKEKNSFINGQTIFLRKFKDIFEYDKTKTFLCLAISLKENTSNYAWEYDAKSLKPSRIVMTNIDFSRFSTLTKILNKIGNDESIPPLVSLTKHDSHVIRWDAVRALINLNFNLGVEVLKKMCNDDHIEIRNSARISLQKLNIN